MIKFLHLPSFATLVRLGLANVPMGPAGWILLGDYLRRTPSLRYLDITNTSNVGGDTSNELQAFATLLEGTDLAELNMTKTRIRQESLSALFASMATSKLTSLNVGKIDLSPLSVAALVRGLSACPFMSTLNIRSTKFNVECATVLPILTHMRHVDVSQNKLQNMLKALLDCLFSRCPFLSNIQLAGVGLSIPSFRSLAPYLKSQVLGDGPDKGAPRR